MNIIEKLGLNGSLDYYDPESAEIFEQQRNELLKLLIDETIFHETLTLTYKGTFTKDSYWRKNVAIIENITDYKWSDIKKQIKELI